MGAGAVAINSVNLNKNGKQGGNIRCFILFLCVRCNLNRLIHFLIKF
jgi:hypothetical protein